FKEIHHEILTHSKAYNWLGYLSLNIGGRLSGSFEAEKAVNWSFKTLDSLKLDKVWKQKLMVPKWTRGVPEYAYITQSDFTTFTVNIAALGGSVATPLEGTRGEIIEVNSFDELHSLGQKNVEGKIVFYNTKMPDTVIQSFHGYGPAVQYRVNGAKEAAKYGAIGVIVRSVTQKLDDFPHTGSMSYGELTEEQKIPAAAISTKDADKLSTLIKLDKVVEFYFRMSCRTFPDVESYNVIGEIKGSKYPNSVIVVGAHLDSWDLGQGAHDDGAGVVQAMEVLRTFKQLKISPKHTIRVVLFMNEENGLRGAIKYKEWVKNAGEKALFAIESDAGGFAPRGYSFDVPDADFEVFESYNTLFYPYLIDRFDRGGSGADIRPLKELGTLLAGLRPDSQRYFDYHHAASDTFDKVNKRELELGAAAMASLVYLVDQIWE
ncbi:MAG: M20/M25/M40 family metallo-hydrolase, partial [Flavobacteriaceae bacterium]|nr:M20/M25/M40 family metallo-hydrolase [Flavobacteriaceae bacterium]